MKRWVIAIEVDADTVELADAMAEFRSRFPGRVTSRTTEKWLYEDERRPPKLPPGRGPFVAEHTDKRTRRRRGPFEPS